MTLIESLLFPFFMPFQDGRDAASAFSARALDTFHAYQ